ncbi:MAG: response regulator transcription factor [Methylobacteriaceae bacterium]|jgi:DNA-binding NarL/FixJ family response regulator|nr:response regulator transcription factor [Methylobacteriaceae bacterium]
MTSPITTIVIADDHPLFRAALRQTLDSLLPSVVVLEASGTEELSRIISETGDIDMVLLDLNMPGVEGFSGLLYLRAQHPEIPVVVVSGMDDPSVIRRSIEFGASGFIPKSLDVDVMGKAISAVLGGDTWVPPDVDLSAREDKETADLTRRFGTLTPQQIRVLKMLSEGLLNKQIAYELNVSEATVKAHVSAILDKLNVDSRTQAVIVAAKIGVTRSPLSSE